MRSSERPRNPTTYSIPFRIGPTFLLPSMLVPAILALPPEEQSSKPTQQSPQPPWQHHPAKQEKTKQEPNTHQGQQTVWIGKELVDVESEINSRNRQEQKSRPKTKQENKGTEKKSSFGLRRAQIL